MQDYIIVVGESTHKTQAVSLTLTVAVAAAHW